MDDNKDYIDEKVEDWVISKVDQWRDHYQANYKQKFDEYYRLWRGIWAAQDKTRDSERSRLFPLPYNKP
jgi:hypothetical protein